MAVGVGKNKEQGRPQTLGQAPRRKICELRKTTVQEYGCDVSVPVVGEYQHHWLPVGSALYACPLPPCMLYFSYTKGRMYVCLKFQDCGIQLLTSRSAVLCTEYANFVSALYSQRLFASPNRCCLVNPTHFVKLRS